MLLQVSAAAEVSCGRHTACAHGVWWRLTLKCLFSALGFILREDKKPGLFMLTAVSLVPGIRWVLSSYLSNGMNEIQQVGNRPIDHE